MQIKQSRFAQLLTLVTFFVVIFIVGYPTWNSLAERWMQFDLGYSHGFLVLLISVVLLVRGFLQADLSPTPGKIYLVPLMQFSVAVVFVLAIHANIQVLQWLILPILMLLFLLMASGFEAFKKSLFPIGFLIFAIPIWGVLTRPLQFATTAVNTWMLRLFGIPVHIEEFFVSIPQGTFEIAGGCSGLHYLVVILSLAALYSYLNLTRPKQIILLLVVAIFFGLATNWLRVFIIIYMGYATDMQTSLITEGHDLFGWQLFAVIMIPFYTIAYFISSREEDQKRVVESSVSAVDRPSLRGLLLAVTITALPVYAIEPKAPDDSLKSWPGLPFEVAEQPLHIVPEYKNSDLSYDQSILFENRVIQVSIRAYNSQVQGDKELVSWGNRNYSREWALKTRAKLPSMRFEVIENKKSGESLAVSYRYKVGGIETANPSIAKLLELSKPLIENQDSSVVLLAAPCSDLRCESENQLFQRIFSSSEIMQSVP